MSLASSPGDLEPSAAGTRRDSLLEYNRQTWIRLSNDGRRSKEDVMAKREGWPEKFGGAFEQFVRSKVPVP